MADTTFDYAIHPGEYLREVLEAYEMTQSELAKRTGLTEKHLSHIITGKVRLTTDVAIALELVFPSRPASLWTRLQARFDEVESRKKSSDELSMQRDWVVLFPYKDLVKRGAVPEASGTVDKAENLLKFFAVSNVDAWRTTFSEDLDIACRGDVVMESGPIDKSTAAFASWFRLGQIQVEKVIDDKPPFDRSGLHAIVPSIRLMCASTDIHGLVEQLESMLSDVGVQLVFERELPGMKTYAYSQPGRGRKPALIQLSMYRKYHDQFCFSLFHEIGHLLKGSDERAADDFAQSVLISANAYEAFVMNHSFSKARIVELAAQQGIHPGIVVGRLQREGLLPFSHLNGLRQRYEWSD